MIGSIIGSVVSGVFSTGKQYLQNKNQESTAKHEAKMAYLKAKTAWEMFMARGSMNSYKDEFWTVVIAAPLVLAFYPPAVEWVQRGFEVLQTFPNWYLYFLGISFSAAFGAKPLGKAISDAIKKVRK